MLRFLKLATTVCISLPASSRAFFASSGTFIACPQTRYFSSRIGQRGHIASSLPSKVKKTTFLPSQQPARLYPSPRKTATRMEIEIVPVLGGLETAAALWVGHFPGVVIGAMTVLWATSLKEVVNQNFGALKSVGSVFGGMLTFLTVTMLGVRTFTAGPDTRYINGFPPSILHPEGCTRVAAEGGNKGIAVPVFKTDPATVQAEAKSWLLSQPRTRIETEVPGYLHAKSLSLIFGFPDSIGVKVFKNKSGKTEVWVQSELRVGQGDLGVNLRRMERLLGHLGSKLS